MIRSRLSEADGALLAEPVPAEGDGAPGWRGPDGVALVPAATLPPAERASLEARREESEKRITGLAEALEAQGDAGRLAGKLLRLALVTPDGTDSLYAAGELPVLVAWGLAAPGQTVPGEEDPPASVTAAAAAATSGTAAEEATSEAAGSATAAALGAAPGSGRARGRFWPAWLLPLALLGLLAWLLWHAWLEQEPIVEVVVPPAPPPENPLPPFEASNEALRELVAATGSTLEKLPMVCVALPPPPEPEPEPEPVAESEPVAEPEPEPPAPNAVTTLEKPPSCPVATPAELLIVIDTSGSMQYKYNADPALERRLMALSDEADRLGSRMNSNPLGMIGALPRIAQMNQEAQRLMQGLMSGPGPRRIAVAKQASRAIVDAMPPVVDISLVTFYQCQHRNNGTFPAGRRGQLKQRIANLNSDAGTPLGATLQAIPRLTRNGRSGDRPVNVVVVSDGQDSCGNDPCASARRLKQAMPYAVVSVVAASRNIGSLRCIAEATDGLFLEAGSAAELDVAVRKASGQERAEGCP